MQNKSPPEVPACLERQLDELAAISAIFDGVLASDGGSLCETIEQSKLEKWKTLDDIDTSIPNISFMIREPCLKEGWDPFEMNVTLPLLYPVSHTWFRETSASFLSICQNAPPIWAVQNQSLLTDSQCDLLLEKLAAITKQKHGEEVLFGCIECIKGFVNDAFTNELPSKRASASTAALLERRELPPRADLQSIRAFQHMVLSKSIPVLGRRVCWSHHIRADVKRRLIIDWSRQLGLGGFSKIGYPGVIIVEGPEASCQEFVNCIQRLRWKHFVVRGEQTEQGKEGQTIDDMRLLAKPPVVESTEMSTVAQRCKEAGLENLFLTCMRIYR